MYTAEREAPFSRSFNEVTAITGYAGGKGTGPAEQICYHGGAADTEYSHYHYTEAVQVTLGNDDSAAAAQYKALVTTYFADTFNKVGEKWIRGDPGDKGPMYRNALGVPGGLTGPFASMIQQANIHSMPLLEGGANGDPSGDTLDEGVVYVYCSITYPFYQAEAYHQFHPNWVLNRDLPAQYLTDAKAAALDRGLTYYTCGEDGVVGAETTNIAMDTGGCINVASTDGTVTSAVTPGDITTLMIGVTSTSVTATAVMAASESVDSIFGAAPAGTESLMEDKGDGLGSCVAEVQQNLRWGSERGTATGAVQVACHNRRYAEYSGYWLTTDFPAAAAAADAAGKKLKFYDSVTGKVRRKCVKGVCFFWLWNLALRNDWVE
jgi:hypothetical protein